MVDKLLFSFDSFPSIATSVAVFLSLIADSSDAAHADCALPEKNIVLARVVFKEAKLYFISGTRKGAFECPSAANACRLKAYLVAEDEVLMKATDAAYVCVRYKSRDFIETLGYLPRAALETVSSEHLPIEKWNGTWRRDSEAGIILKSSGDEVTVSGNATWAAAIRSASNGAQSTRANSKVPSDHGVMCCPSAMIRTLQGFRPPRMQRRTSVPRSWSCMTDTC